MHILSESDDRLDVIEALLELGADVNAQDCRGHTALDAPVDREDDAKIDLLARSAASAAVTPEAAGALRPPPLSASSDRVRPSARQLLVCAPATRWNCRNDLNS
ncbi:MAG: hypothetical protein ABWY12_21040 [Burkholderiales bacterium]